MNSSYHDKLLASSRAFFSRWRGANGFLFELTVSHRSLRILLMNDDIDKNLLVSCIDPMWITAPVRWTNANLVLESGPNETGDEIYFRLIDDKAGVNIICGAVEIKENVKGL
jgi:hypothetical protein